MNIWNALDNPISWVMDPYLKTQLLYFALIFNIENIVNYVDNIVTIINVCKVMFFL